MAWAALATAGIKAGASLLGGIFDNNQNEKTQNAAFLYQSQLNNVQYVQQNALAIQQNNEVRAINDRISAYNADVLENHSTSTTTGSIDFGRLVADAEAAGFNPLTVLRAGGLAGYSTTNTTMARDAMTFLAPGEIPIFAPSIQAPQGFASTAGTNAAAAFNQAWPGFTTAEAKERLELEMGLARAQIANLNSDTAYNNRRMAVPSWTSPGFTTSTGGFGGAVASALPRPGLGKPAQPEVGKVTVTNPHGVWDVRASQRDAAAYEERYGEFSADVIGIGIGAIDAVHNAVPVVKRAGNAVMDYTDAAANYLKQQYNALLRSWNGAPAM